VGSFEPFFLTITPPAGSAVFASIPEILSAAEFATVRWPDTWVKVTGLFGNAASKSSFSGCLFSAN